MHALVLEHNCTRLGTALQRRGTFFRADVAARHPDSSPVVWSSSLASNEDSLMTWFSGAPSGLKRAHWSVGKAAASPNMHHPRAATSVTPQKGCLTIWRVAMMAKPGRQGNVWYDPTEPAPSRGWIFTQMMGNQPTKKDLTLCATQRDETLARRCRPFLGVRATGCGGSTSSPKGSGPRANGLHQPRAAPARWRAPRLLRTFKADRVWMKAQFRSSGGQDAQRRSESFEEGYFANSCTESSRPLWGFAHSCTESSRRTIAVATAPPLRRLLDGVQE